MRIVGVLCLLHALYAHGAGAGFEQLRQSYEQFFTARYALEQEFPFRLISVRDRLVQITPNTEVRKPLLALTAEDFLAGEKIEALLTKSFLPLLYGTTTSEQGDALTLARQFVTSALQQLGSVGREKLHLLLQKIPERKLSYTLFLAPYRKYDADLYYGKQKISMVRNGTVSLRTDHDAQHHISQAIDHYRALLFYNHKPHKQRVPEFLAARLHFTANEQEAWVYTDILLNLFPQTLPFVKEEAPVSFQKFVVPTGSKFRFPTALLSVHLPLNETEKPQLYISFGHFQAVKNMQFVFDDKTNHLYSPYFEGSLQKFSPLLVKFRLQKIAMSLEKLQAEEVRTAFSMGFQLGTMRSADFGKFKIAKIDKKFKTAINKEIDAAKGKLFNDTLTPDNIGKFFSDSTAQALHHLFRVKLTSKEDNR